MKKCLKTSNSLKTLIKTFSLKKTMETSAHYANMLLTTIKMSQHSDATGISAIQNVLITIKTPIWVEMDNTYAQ